MKKRCQNLLSQSSKYKETLHKDSSSNKGKDAFMFDFISSLLEGLFNRAGVILIILAITGFLFFGASSENKSTRNPKKGIQRMKNALRRWKKSARNWEKVRTLNLPCLTAF